MSRTTFLLGTDPEHCADLQEVLQAWISDAIVTITPSLDESIRRLKKSDTIIISREERKSNVVK